jgi:alanine racemase
MASARAVIGPRSVISLSTIEANYLAIKAFAPGAETAAVVKADAYGHGIAETSARLRQAGCNTFFVAYPHEGEALRNVIGGAPDVYVFNGVTKDTLSVFAAARLSPVCNHPDEISIWLKSELPQNYAVHFDTGMNRLGLRQSETEAVRAQTSHRPPALVMSHLACADKPDSEMNGLQLQRFAAIRAQFPGSKASLSSTGGIYLGTEYHFDILRPGIGLYGGGPARPVGLKLKPALTLTAPVISVFDIEPGETVGYGGTFTARRPTTLATVALGYADGYLRSASSFGFAIMNKMPCPVIGRVSMDLTTIDVTDLNERPSAGEYAEFIGPRAGLEIQAEAAGTIGYELTSRLGGRISRSWSD